MSNRTRLFTAAISLCIITVAAFALTGVASFAAMNASASNALEQVRAFWGISALASVVSNSAEPQPTPQIEAPLAVLLSWNTFGNAGTETTEPSNANDPGIASANLTFGAGVTAAANVNRFGGNSWFDTGDTNPTTLSESVSGNDYIQFIVTPNSGFAFTPTSFVFSWDHSSTGPGSVTLRSSVDGYTTDLGSVTGMAASITTGNTINITGLNNLTTATTFRLYGYGATASTGTGGFDTASSVNNVVINGTTTALVSVTYNGNGNTGGTAPVDGSSPYASGSWVGVAGPGSLVNTGFQFGGWNTAANGTGTQYNPGQSFVIGANTTLYAQWITAPCFASGSLDPTFDTDGKVTTQNGSGESIARSVTIQPDGKIVTAGYTRNASNYDIAVFRYNSNGSLDTTFDTDGKVQTTIGSDDLAYAVAVQSDGKIVTAGYTTVTANNDFSVARYNSNGSIDNTFDGNGWALTPIGTSGDIANAVAIQPDGKIVAAGASFTGTNDDFALVRYDGTTGFLDTSFSGDGKVTTATGTGPNVAYAVAIQPDRKIVAAGNQYNGAIFGNDFALVRYNPDGTLDTSFSGNGKLTTSFGSESTAYSVAIQPDGKIVAAGVAAGDFAVVRYNPDGSLDTSFDTDGIVTTPVLSGSDVAQSVAIQPDGKIVVAGRSSNGTNNDFAVVRYNADGSLDTSFDGDGKATTAVLSGNDNAFGVAIQRDGRIVVAGSSISGAFADFAVVRYGASCSVPPTVSSVSPTSGPTAGGNSVTITGTGFTGVTAVTFDGLACTGVNFVSDTQISCTAPAHAAGAVSVDVTTTGGTNAANTLYTYVQYYTVTYDGNTNTGGSAPTDPNSPYPSGSTVTVLGNTGSLVKAGSTFTGWNTQADGLGLDRAPASTFTINANTTLYAKWTPSCVTDPVVTTNTDSGAGSLRNAIAVACAGSTITFDMNTVVSPISLPGGQITLSKNLTIQGPGANLLTVQNTSGASATSRVFVVDNGVTASISGITISGGVLSDTGRNGAGIHNSGQLTLTDCTVSGNQINGSYLQYLYGIGAGIYNSGTLTINNSLINGNYITNYSYESDPNSSGAGIYNSGTGTLNLNNSVVSNNSAETAAGIDNAGTMTILNSTIFNNSVGRGSGGGIIQRGGSLTITNSTISGNTANNGGGIYYYGGPTSITNCTITGNNGYGGGIYNYQYALSGTVPAGVFTIRNTILAGNPGGDYYFPNDSSIPPAGYANLTSLGNNIFGNVDAPLNWTFTGPGDQVGSSSSPINPLLGALLNNGGPTQTHALLPGSPAIDAGDNCVFDNTCSPLLGVALTTDQRGTGFPRKLGSAVDVGAFEASPPPTVTAVNPTSGPTAGGNSVTITGTGFTGVTAVTFDGLACAGVNFVSDTQISCTAPAHAAGPANVVVTTSSGTNAVPFVYTYVAPAATTTAVSKNPVGDSFVNDNVTFTATVVSAGNPVTVGTMTFTEGATTLASNVALNGSGQASFATTALTEGSHTITATYSGTAAFLTSSGSVSHTVNTPTVVSGNTFTNPGGIIVADGVGGTTASPYPSNVFVSGLSGSITKVTLALTNLNLTNPDNVDILLVAPNGAKFVPFSHVGGSTPTGAVNLVLDDTAASALPDSAALSSGTFRPTAFSSTGVVFPAPAPAGPHNFAAPAGSATFASSFNGISPNGTWKLFVTTRGGGARQEILSPEGVVAGGTIGSWGLTLFGDITPPDTTITANPTNPSASSNASFSFTGSDPGGSGVASFQCQIDGGGFSACTSPQTYTGLSDGSHTFQVRAIDAAGNTDQTPASFTWGVDTTPPDATITANPTDPSPSSNASFSFTGSDPGGSGVASFQCQIDGGGFSTCTSPQNYVGLSNGSHTFQVRAIDAVGNIDASPASYTWVIDTTSPTAASAPANVSVPGGTSHTIPVTYTDNLAINVSTIGGSPGADIHVTGPGGFDASATFVSVNNGANGTPRIGTYSITPPGGTWDAADNGTYNVVMQAGGVADTAGNFVSAGIIGSFNVTACVTDPIVLNGNDSGAGSLRQAILDACVGSTITFAPAVTTVTLTTAELLIDKDLTIDGGTGVTVTRSSAVGTPNFRIFRINNTRTATLKALTISNGNVSGIYNDGTLTLDHCAVTGNSNAGVGVGIRNRNTLTMLDSSITGNTGAAGSYGGGLANGYYNVSSRVVSATIIRSTISNNVSDYGGGIHNEAGLLYMTNSTVTGNIANGAAEGGGGLENVGGSAYGGPATAVLTNCTFGGNQKAPSTPVSADEIWSGNYGAQSTVLLKNTIVAGSTSTPTANLALFTDGSVPASGVITSLGNNISTDNGSGLLTGAGDQINTDPLLAVLGNYGGLTQTQALLPGSLAINAGGLSSEIQVATVSGAAGTFTLTFNGQTTSPQAFNVSGAALQSAIEALSTVGAGNASVIQNGTVYIVTFQGSLGGANQPQMNAAGAGGATVAVQTILDGGGPAADQRGVGRPQQGANDIGAFESQGFTIVATGGGSQSAALGTTFANPLVATVSSSFGEPVDGGLVSFNAPASGPSATLATSPATISGAGTASVNATANLTLGSYNVSASSAGAAPASVTFNLTNVCPTITLAPLTLPGGTVNTAYGQTITAAPAGGGYTFGVSGGTLPNGLTLTPAGVLSGTPTGAGTFNFTVTATGYAGQCTGSQSYTVVIAKADTVATITSDTPDPSVFGQNVTVNYTIAGSPSGPAVPSGSVVVTLSGWTDTCTGTVSSGTCVIPLSKVGAGTLVLNYAGDGNFNPSSYSEAHTVNKANTATAVTSTPNPSVWGQSVTMTATISVVSPGAGAPTGTVNFLDGGAPIPSCQNRPVSLVGALYQANCTTPALPVGGPRFMNAVYSGDGNFNGSPSPNGYTITVNKADTTTTIVSDNPDPSVIGQNYTVVFTVTANAPGAGTPTGTVSVTDGTNNCSATVAVGQCVLPSTSIGPKTLTATYPGDTNFNGSNDTEAHLVGKADTTTSVVSSLNPSVFGQSVTFTATVAAAPPGAGTPTGTVSFNIDGNIYCPNTPLANVGGAQKASCTQAGLPALAAGNRVVVALYNGDANFNSSAGTLSGGQVVNKAATTIAITGDTPDPTIIGQPYTVSWAVSVTAPGAGTPTATVTVVDGTGGTCTAAVAAGGCSLTSTTVGTKTLVATYSGDSNFLTSTSAGAAHVVNLQISGTIRNGLTNAPISGITVGLYQMPAGTFITSAVTNASGVYTFLGQYTGTIALQPTPNSPPFYEPNARFYTLTMTSNVSGADFLSYANIGDFPRTISFPTQFVSPNGATGSMPVIMNSLGNEGSVAFSFSYDINIFSQPPTVVCGANAPNCTVTLNNSVFGKVGVTIVPAGGIFSRPDGTPLEGPEVTAPKEIAKINFQTVPTTAPSTDFTIGNTPTPAAITETVTNNPLNAVLYLPVRVVFTQGIEGDVAGRNTGNGVVDSSDVVQVRRFVTGLDTPVATHNEFQRADVAPSNTKGNGILDATDVIQARRYAAGLDTSGPAGGPGLLLPAVLPPPAEELANSPREVTAGEAAAAPRGRVSVPVSLNASGDETAVSFNVRYDETRLTNPNVTLAANAPEGAVLTANTDEPGVIRILIDANSPFAREAARGAMQLVDISFEVTQTAPSGETQVRIEDGVISDANARALNARYTAGAVTVYGPNPPADDSKAKPAKKARQAGVSEMPEMIEEWLNKSILTIRPREERP